MHSFICSSAHVFTTNSSAVAHVLTRHICTPAHKLTACMQGIGYRAREHACKVSSPGQGPGARGQGPGRPGRPLGASLRHSRPGVDRSDVSGRTRPYGAPRGLPGHAAFSHHFRVEKNHHLTGGRPRVRVECRSGEATHRESPRSSGLCKR